MQKIIYTEALRKKIITNKPSNEKKVGDEKKTEEEKHTSEIINMITSDVGTVIGVYESFNDTWMAIVRLISGLVYLYIKMKEAIGVGLIISIILIYVNFKIAHKIGILLVFIKRLKI